MAVGIFAGIAVSDFRQALDWYRRFLGAEPTFYPNDIEAVWELARDRSCTSFGMLTGPAARSA
jgi:catechol 2,3-dioxygenase-like lactoylglutathione lyase family enzyme